jgi:uncharacterized protein YfbU (UPF0304 family)
MDLSKVERYLLAAIFDELAKADKKKEKGEEEKWRRFAKIVRGGFEGEYEKIEDFVNPSEPLSKKDCKEVSKILEMYEAIQFSFRKLDNPSIEEEDVVFLGFDDESRGAYARYLTGIGQEISPLNTGDGYIGHSPMLERYRKMLKSWENIGEEQKLTENEIKELLEAGELL